MERVQKAATKGCLSGLGDQDADREMAMPPVHIQLLPHVENLINM